MKHKYSRNRHGGKKLVLLVLLAAALGLAGWLAYQRLKDRTYDDKAGTADVGTLEGGQINYGPPTEEDKKETEANKQRLIDEGPATNPQPNDSNKQTVTPVIGFLRQASNGDVEANGYVSEAIESDGTCTLTLAKSGVRESISQKAMPDAQSTVCGLLTIDRSKLSKGTWTATISYSSAKHQGVSSERTITVD